jgi:hypothetical protein
MRSARRLARACTIADFINKSTFIDDPNPPEEEAADDEDMADMEEDDFLFTSLLKLSCLHLCF